MSSQQKKIPENPTLLQKYE